MIDVKIGVFQFAGAVGSMILQVSKDRKRIQGFVGNRVQKVFDNLKWNTTYVIGSLTGVYFPQNDSYNGNIGLIERNLVDMYFAPNSYNVLTRKIGLSRAVFASDLLVMQIVDPPKMQAAVWVVTVLIASLIFKSYLCTSKLLNKGLNWKILAKILLAGNFYCVSLFIEQIKSQDHSNWLFKFAISILMIGIWLANRLFGGFLRKEFFKIDSSKIITSLSQTFDSDYQACLVANEPTTTDFIESKLKMFAKMFPTKPRHLYSTELVDMMNFMRHYKTRLFIASSLFIRSLSWSFCSFFKDEMGGRKIFSPKFVIDQTIGVFYYNLKADKQILDDIDKKYSVAVIEQSLSFYLRNPAQINLLENDVQNSCVVRNLEVFEDASYHSGDNFDRIVEFDSYSNFMKNYFLFINFVPIITSVVYVINYLNVIRAKRSKTFFDKLSCPLDKEKLLQELNLNRVFLDELHLKAKIMNEIIESKEFYTHLNPFHTLIIKQEYRLIRLKYRKFKNEIEEKIFEQDSRYQSLTKLSFDFEYHRPAKGIQRKIQFKQQLYPKFQPLTDQRFLSNKMINFRDDNRLRDNADNLTHAVILDEKYSKSNIGQYKGLNTKKSKIWHYLCKVWSTDFSNQVGSSKNTNQQWQNRDILTRNDKCLFEYRLPNNLDLIEKYIKPSNRKL